MTFLWFYFFVVSLSVAGAHTHSNQGKNPGLWLLVTALCKYFSWVFIAHFSTVNDLTNQIMILESGIMDGPHQRTSAGSPASLSLSGHALFTLLANFYFCPAPLGILSRLGPTYNAQQTVQ